MKIPALSVWFFTLAAAVAAQQTPAPATPGTAALTGSEGTVDTMARTRFNEAMALLDAAERGGTVNRIRLTELVDTLRREPGLAGHERFRIASRAGGLAIQEQGGLDRAGRLAAYEAAARVMSAEFPDELEPFAALLALAEDQPDQAASVRIARDLLTAPAPEAIKAGAQTVLDRLDLVGKPLDFVLEDNLGLTRRTAEYRGKVVVLYVWTGQGTRPPSWVSGLLRQGRDGVVFIGLNFDPDRRAAIVRTGEVALGSTQVYDPTGLGGVVARQLRITRIPTVYLIDKEGILRDVHGGHELPLKLAGLLAEGGRS